MANRRNRQIVPQSKHVLDQMKYEIASEFGLQIHGYTPENFDTEFAVELGQSGYSQTTTGWGHLTSRENGSVGGEITKRLVRMAEQSMK